MRRPTLRPIDQLTAEWAVVSATPESRRALEALAKAEPLIAELQTADLGALISTLRRADSPASRTLAARTLQAMLRSQSAHPLVSRAILQALLPGLVTVARRLSWGSGGDWSDGGAFFADVLATAWEVITAWSGDDRAYAVLDLLSAVRCRVRRQLIRDRMARSIVAGAEIEEQLTSRSTLDLTGLDELARTLEGLSGHGLDPGDAAVVYANRVLGFSIAELSRMSGRSRRHLSTRRHRAEQHLCA